ncbi:MAG: hypothetical protein ABSH16_00195 [Sedimentisphaerales bacterium]
MMGLINALQLQAAATAKTVAGKGPAPVVLQSGTVSGSFEPLITPKAIGYLKWNGSAWMFLNQQYDISGEMTVLILNGLSAPPAVQTGKLLVYWLLAQPGILYGLFDNGTIDGMLVKIFDGTGGGTP